MKVSKDWLKELVEIKSIEAVEKLLPLMTIGTKEMTPEFIELDMKGYNRADLLSLRGVALEVAAITDSEVKFTETSPNFENLPEVAVEVENPDLCPVYCVAKIAGLRVGPSNNDWTKKLTDSGFRPVNNIADITNLVMLEYGQPLHAFDSDKIGVDAKAVKNETIIVRTAKKGERITTLDGKTRDLEETDLLIADPQNNLGIAGVMGGKDSEITDSTNTILLEAAIFDPVSIRKTATRLKLQSEASKRFYHGLTRKRLLQALDAAIKMYQNLGGRLTALTIVGDTKDPQKKVPLTLEKTNSLIGIDLKPAQIEEYLKKLNFDLRRHLEGEQNRHLPGAHNWVVTPPYWRLDINIEEDLIEEVARMYGYENIPAKSLKGELPEKVDQSLPNFIYDLKTALVEQGLTEVQTYSFYSTKILENLDYKKEELVKIANPISAETEFLRDHLWPNLLEVTSKNLRQGFEDIAIFEVGKVYKLKKDNTPAEIYKMAIAIFNNTDNPVTELYQLFQKLAELMALGVTLDVKSELQGTHFHPKRYARVILNKKDIGKIGEVHQRFTDKFGLPKRVAVLEIKLEMLL